MYCSIVSEEWSFINSKDLWIYNKLNLSQVLGYTCGPAGLEVPRPDFYIIRPSQNFMGMGRFTRIEYLEKDTEHLHPGEFWCEVFEGEHLSVDFHYGVPELIVKGERKESESFYKWSKWYKVERDVKFPNILEDLKNTYEWINCEFIGDKLIEVHFRRNSDFRHGNSVAIPVWSHDEFIDDDLSKYKYIKDRDYHRLGFWIS